VAKPPPQSTPAQFGAAIRVLRRRQELTIEEFASRADIHWTYLSSIENGHRNPSWEIITKLSVALGVDLGEIAQLAAEQTERGGGR
jgi:transcriptional regulator with XRE-family HTH domain